MTELQLTNLKGVQAVVRASANPNLSASTDDDRVMAALRDGSMTSSEWLTAMTLCGHGYIAHGGAGSSPITFGATYDADAPDLYVWVPNGCTIIPTSIQVSYEAIGTEEVMEVIGLVSSTGDSTITGTEAIIWNLRLDQPYSSSCKCEVAVDNAGITDPNAGDYFEFWRVQRNLTDTTASTENDRPTHRWEWNVGNCLTPPVIVGRATTGSCLAVYAASQAGTGFITATWVEVPSKFIV